MNVTEDSPMTWSLVRASALVALVLSLSPAFAADDYPLGPDSQEQPGVPKGSVKEFSWKESRIFPGTDRRYWIYLPPGFDAGQEYPLIVFQDGGGAVGVKSGFRATIVLDNLIAKKDVPAMVALFVDPGTVHPVTPKGHGRSTRSFEYDTPDDAYARFLIEEMLPEVAKLAKISPKPEDRAVVGISSGGICAFTVAWFRPDAFRKVITGIGSFTNIQGGYWYPSAIRKTEHKPLRIFLQDGDNDLDNVHGSWPYANREMAAALHFAGYDFKAVFGDGGHSGKQLGSLLPDALRWLWRRDDAHPAPVPEVKQDLSLAGLMIDGQDWQVVADGMKAADAACTDADGNFYFSDLGGGTGLHKVAVDGTASVYNKDATGISGMKFGPDGRLYACQNRERRIVAINPAGALEVLATDIGCNDLVVDHKGHIYVTDTGRHQVVLVEGAGKSRVVDTGIPAPNGIALSPDQETLAVSDYGSTAVWAFRVEANGDLSAKMPVMPYRSFGRIQEGKGDAMICDTRGRWYCSSQQGVQVFDPNGRPVGLVLAPTSAAITSVALSGPDLGWLFVLSRDTVYKRKVNANGFMPSLEPIY
jgi:enterochelin esterase family protein